MSNELFSLPPSSIEDIRDGNCLAESLKSLIGHPFALSGKPRTDGSNLRKLISQHLLHNGCPEPAQAEEYVVVKKKGIPRMLLEVMDTYIVTTGEFYNLQIWNRMPSSTTTLVRYRDGKKIRCRDIRLVLVKVDSGTISAIVVLTPDYVESHFGKFGKPTIKHQLIISEKLRNEIINSTTHILIGSDSAKLIYKVSDMVEGLSGDMMHEPEAGDLYSIKAVKELVAEKLIGKRLEANDTKTRGQKLERMVLELLRYSEEEIKSLAGGYPDIPNQLLEVKLQDSPTIDLGKYSPEYEEDIDVGVGYTPKDVRYLIALTNPQTYIIEGIVLMSGEQLGEYFSYVASKSYKCQRSIPMSFFDSFKGEVVFNPKYQKPI